MRPDFLHERFLAAASHIATWTIIMVLGFSGGAGGLIFAGNKVLRKKLFIFYYFLLFILFGIVSGIFTPLVLELFLPRSITDSWSLLEVLFISFTSGILGGLFFSSINLSVGFLLHVFLARFGIIIEVRKSGVPGAKEQNGPKPLL